MSRTALIRFTHFRPEGWNDVLRLEVIDEDKTTATVAVPAEAGEGWADLLMEQLEAQDIWTDSVEINWG
jgi:hypothetical protein